MAQAQAPKTVPLVEESVVGRTERRILGMRIMRLGAVKVGDVYVLAVSRKGERYVVVCQPGGSENCIYAFADMDKALERPYPEDELLAFYTLLDAVRRGGGVEQVELSATAYDIEQRHRAPWGEESTTRYTLVEWADGGRVYAIELEEGEELVRL